jgi:hypothetical protein
MSRLRRSDSSLPGYIDPRVFDRYRAGVTIAVPPVGEAALGDLTGLKGTIEEAVIYLLDGSAVESRAA